MVTLAASAYFLTCCRPIYNSSFCFCVETPKLVNLHSRYPNKCHVRQEEDRKGCICHDKLQDHCLNEFNSCTDGRAWSFDNQQRRKHFVDIVCQRIPLCGIEHASLIKEKKPKENKHEHISDSWVIVESKEEKTKEKSKPEIETPPTVDVKPKEEEKEEGKKQTLPLLNIESKEEDIKVPPPLDVEPKKESPQHSDVDLVPVKEKEKPAEVTDPINDELIDKLDKNLANLESTFDKFVRKNKDFIQNLVGLLNFEKRKQKSLEDNYNKLKHENEVLKTKNEYLKMVNVKQLELFRDELDKGISENKALYKKKIREMEAQIQADQDKMQHYKQMEKRYQDIVENENKEVEKLRKEIKVLKEKETKLLKNYVEILNFLEDVKQNLNKSEESPKPETTPTPNDSEVDPHLMDVLKTALYNGMDTLNVRDLSILHDAIQQMNEELCHQHGFCGKNPVSNIPSIRHLSAIIYEEYAPPDYVPRDFEAPSNLSMYPSRQTPDSRRVQFT